jgi:hypothetical protein
MKFYVQYGKPSNYNNGGKTYTPSSLADEDHVFIDDHVHSIRVDRVEIPNQLLEVIEADNWIEAREQFYF